MRKIFTSSVYFIVTIAIFSCGKNEPAPTAPIDILTGGTSKSWLLINVKSNGVNDIEPCETDNVFTFTKATSKALIDVGAKKCSTSDVNETNDFKLSEDGKILTLSGFGFTVVKLTDAELELKITVFGSTSESFLKAK